MIELSTEAAAAIRAHGAADYPEECCGALLGSVAGGAARVLRAEPLENERADERRRRFLIDPWEYRRMERLAEAEGLSLLGFYHSHPDHPAVPSEYDREHAFPFFHYLVMAVAAGRPGEISSWILSEDRGEFERERLVATTGR